jgi:hypothetical protein
MKIIVFAGSVVLALGFCGCAGIDLKSISNEDAVKAHAKGSSVSGYIVYQPVVVVEIGQKDVCVKKDSEGNCKAQETRCFAGMPFVLPDYSKPYLIDIKSGFGKSGADITIADGWRLGNVKDNSDNSAILGTIEKLFTHQSSQLAGTQDRGCKAPGLYRVDIDQSGIALSRILVY